MTTRQRLRRRAILNAFLFITITLIGPALAGMIAS